MAAQNPTPFPKPCVAGSIPAGGTSTLTNWHFVKRPEYGLGIWDRRSEYGHESGALGHTGLAREGYRTAALCFQDPGIVVVVLANADEHDVDTTAGALWRAAST
jgi:CubicO group peptidase (beta-lactamase class C family)